MEIPVINRITHFEALNYPPFISKAYHVLSGFQKIYETHSYFKWGALILTLIASLSTIINKLKIFIIRFRRHDCKQYQPLLYDTDFDSGSDTDSSSDDEPEYEEPSISHNRREVHETFRFRNSGDEWQNSEGLILTSEKSVVKLWDNPSLGFGFDVDESDDVLNLHDVKKGTNGASIFGDLQAISAPFSSPVVFVSAGVDSSSRRVTVGAWDTRLHCREPAIVAEWRPKESVAGKLTVGDMGMVISPLTNLTEWDGDIWCDVDSGTRLFI